MYVAADHHYHSVRDVHHAGDEVLLQRIAQKDIHAFEVFYQRHAQAALGLLMRILRDHTIAEELLQETFWLVWQKPAQYAGRGSVAAWLLRIARNQALDELRRQKSRPQVSKTLSDLLEMDQPVDPEDVDYQFDQLWSRQQIAHALGRLPAEQRVCIEMIYFGGFSEREVAEQMHTPLGTVKSRLRLGLGKVGYLLQAAGFGAQTPQLQTVG